MKHREDYEHQFLSIIAKGYKNRAERLNEESVSIKLNDHKQEIENKTEREVSI